MFGLMLLLFGAVLFISGTDIEVVKASNVDEAFVKARDKGEQRYSMYKCVVSENILHPDSIVKDINDIDFKAELNKAFAELDLL